MRRARLLLVSPVLLLAGCLTGRVNARAVMQPWQGRQASELIAQWGQPQATLSDGHGGRTLVYMRDRDWSTPPEAATRTIPNPVMTANGVVDEPITYTEYTPGVAFHSTEMLTVRVNAEGRIVGWSWKAL